MLHKCPDAAVIRPKKVDYGTILSPLQSADTEGFLSPSVTLHSHGASLAVGLCTCKFLLMALFLCASPNLTNFPHWKPAAKTFSALSVLSKFLTFFLFLPYIKQSTQFLFPINVFSTGRRKGCCSSLATAALFRACHPQAEGKNLCPCSAAGLQHVSLVMYLVGLQLPVTQLHNRSWAGSLGLCQALLKKKKKEKGKGIYLSLACELEKWFLYLIESVASRLTVVVLGLGTCLVLFEH